MRKKSSTTGTGSQDTYSDYTLFETKTAPFLYQQKQKDK